jgi:hypothetical protein
MECDLFLTILAMDSYNRGYGRALKLTVGENSDAKNEAGTKIGNASIFGPIERFRAF